MVMAAIPIKKDSFDLSLTEFHDGLCLRYMKPLLSLPPTCDDCGLTLITAHALNCRKRGLVIQHHNGFTP